MLSFCILRRSLEPVKDPRPALCMSIDLLSISGWLMPSGFPSCICLTIFCLHLSYFCTNSACCLCVAPCCPPACCSPWDRGLATGGGTGFRLSALVQEAEGPGPPWLWQGHGGGQGCGGGGSGGVFLAAWLDHLHVDCCGTEREVLALAYRALFSLCRPQALTPPTRS